MMLTYEYILFIAMYNYTVFVVTLAVELMKFVLIMTLYTVIIVFV